MLSQRLDDLENEREYARYQIEVRVLGAWYPRAVYACPREWLRHLLAQIPIKEDMRLQRVYVTKVDMVMITPQLIGTVAG